MVKKKTGKLHVRIFFDGSYIEGEFDIDAVIYLKNSLYKYIWTGKKDAILVWNIDEKKFLVLNPEKICGIEVIGSLMFVDDIPDKKIDVSKFKEFVEEK
ncbi:hypothetical protein J422_06678 [Methanocaldococcus villosus KIN24-T80]|uniref:Uncharacterized protein n=1 Tax=Methanocaldococcus villosus KIN24-T80 TaxID=1069083 RepID=N6VX15_9EURY|nr:hypothetical protein [Methanocaldococcus villosus]ENN95652.1 hypothetical protein J422_06678 [Methanocaldococcus villosus KIN24-T80]